MKPLLTLLLCHALTVQLSAATALGVREPTPNASTAAQVPVELSTTTAAVALQADVLFSNALYTASDAGDGMQPEGVEVQSRLIEPGRLRVVVHHRSSGALASDIVFQVPLTAKAGVISDDPVVITNIIVSGQGGGALTTTLLPKVRLVGLRGTMNGRLGIEFSATASATAGTISKVEYYVGGVKVGEGSGVNFAFLWTPPASGPFEVNAIAYDSNGQQTSSRSFPVIVTHVGTFNSAVLGSYFGLVRGPQFSFANDGYVTMTSTTTGAFTLKLLIGGKTWTAPAGKFDASGNATTKIVRGKGIKDLIIVLAHSSTPTVDQIHGRIADGTFAAGKFTGHTFETEFTVDRVVWKLKTKEAPQNGAYTMLLPAHDNAATQKAPLGTGYGAVTIGKDGSAKITGALADGSTLTASSFISKDGFWPVYASLYTNTGVIMGDIGFADITDESDFLGPLTWYKPANSKAVMFKDAFLTEVDGVGSRFVKPAVNVRLFPLANVGGNSLLYLNAGGLTTDLTRLVTLNAANKAVVPLQDADAATVVPAPTTGLFTGTFLHPFTQVATPYKGAILQKQKLVAGYFLSGPLGGDVRYAANPAYPPALSDANPIGTAPLPTLTISAPTTNAVVTKFVAGAVVVTGKAVHKLGIASVHIQVLHNGVLSAPTPATIGVVVPATGTTNWTYNIPIGPGEGGHYTVFAKAVRSAGQESEVLTVPFLVPLKSALTVAVNDTTKGSVTTGFLGSTQRDVGKLVSITATPKTKKKFLGWTGAVTSSSPKITVLMKVGMTLTANFGD